MDQTYLAHFTAKLEKEETRLLEELQSLGRVNPTNPKDWEGTYSNLNPDVGADEKEEEPDELDQGVELAEYEERNATETTLEGRYNSVKAALARLADGSYGICSKGDPHAIELERLEANPAATTCIKHLA